MSEHLGTAKTNKANKQSNVAKDWIYSVLCSCLDGIGGYILKEGLA